MRICGIDPGLQVIGYGILDQSTSSIRVCDAGTIIPTPGSSMVTRLHQIYTDLTELFEETHPDLIGLEKVYSHYRFPQTAVLMAHGRGVVMLAAARLGIEIREYAATEIKRTLTGNGRASKIQVQQAIRVQLGLANHPESSDMADALAIAHCAILNHAEPGMNHMQKTRHSV